MCQFHQHFTCAFLPIFWCQKISNPKHSIVIFGAKILAQIDTNHQFHQHFTYKFFLYERRFGSFSLVMFWLWGEICTKNSRVKL